MKRKCKKKGISIIEVILSLAIFGIISAPLSTLVMESVRENKSGEDKQKAAIVAQQIVEEIKGRQQIDENKAVIDTLYIASDPNYPGGYRGTEENVFGKYSVSIDIKPVNELINHSNIQPSIDVDGTLTIENAESPNTGYRIKNSKGESDSIEENLNLNIQNTGTEIIVKNGEDNIVTFDKAADSLSSGKIKIQVGHNCTLTGNVKISISNEVNSPFSIYYVSYSDRSIPYVIENVKGEVKKEPIILEPVLPAGAVTRVYEVNVIISRSGKELQRVNTYKSVKY